MNIEYHWSIGRPGETLSLSIENHDEAGRAFTAAMTLRRRPIATWQLNRLLLRYPFLTAQISCAIYWQAVKLWWKGATFHPHPRHAVNDAERPDVVGARS